LILALTEINSADPPNGFNLALIILIELYIKLKYSK
jgi:hypothetical protein